MAFIRKIKGSLVKKDIESYIGEETYLFYDIVSGSLRIWDGTPGGQLLAGGGGASSLNDLTDVDLTTTAPLVGEHLEWNGTDWIPGEAGAVEIATTIRDDYITDYLMYRGDATPGSLEADSVWRLQKIVTDVNGDVTVTFANGDSDFIYIWNDRLTYTYS